MRRKANLKNPEKQEKLEKPEKKNNHLNDELNQKSLDSYDSLREYAERCLRDFRQQTKHIVNEETERSIRYWLEFIANCISQQHSIAKAQHCIDQSAKQKNLGKRAVKNNGKS